MNIQGYADDLDYVNAILNPNGPRHGSFLRSFCTTCLLADVENYELLRPLLQVFIHKYPADPTVLAREKNDRLSHQ